MNNVTSTMPSSSESTFALKKRHSLEIYNKECLKGVGYGKEAKAFHSRHFEVHKTI